MVNSPQLATAPMKSFRGPINSFFFEEGMKSEYLESGPGSAANTSYADAVIPHQMPFLQMLHAAIHAEEETEEEEEQLQSHRHHHETLFAPYQPESNLQLLLRLQDQRHVEQIESCITHVSQPDTRGPDSAAAANASERKRRKRARQPPTPAASKKTAESESQRMNHIAVERNRRRQMNEHLVALRSLMPQSFIQRGDQASIVGGAIDFVKELEQHLVSLQSEKRLRTSSPADATSSSAASAAAGPTGDPVPSGFFVAPQYRSYSSPAQGEGEGVDVEATVVQGHVSLKVAGRRREGQLVRAIAAMEELRLSVLHLNINSLDPSVLYSLNLKMEDGCKLGSADEIATAVHQIFAYISAC